MMPPSLLVLLGLAILAGLAESGCNEAVCASIVSKCMLTQSCKCDLKNCTCCRDCYNCLDELYYECCSCVEMCPKSNDSDIKLSQKSHLEDLPEHMPELFNALTDEQDRYLRWVAFTFPAHRDITFFNSKMDKEVKFVAVSSSQDHAKLDEAFEELAVNCTVAFMSQCMSWNKCKKSCTSMGASSYRWFHDSCCECVGNTCLNYGINESRCLKCPANKDDEEFKDIDEVDELSDIGSNDNMAVNGKSGSSKDEEPSDNDASYHTKDMKEDVDEKKNTDKKNDEKKE